MTTARCFVTYSGVKPPFNLVRELKTRGAAQLLLHWLFRRLDKLSGFDKLAYGDVELKHCYTYHDNGKLSLAEITDIDGEVTVPVFDVERNSVR